MTEHTLHALCPRSISGQSARSGVVFAVVGYNPKVQSASTLAA